MEDVIIKKKSFFERIDPVRSILSVTLFVAVIFALANRDAGASLILGFIIGFSFLYLNIKEKGDVAKILKLVNSYDSKFSSK